MTSPMTFVNYHQTGFNDELNVTQVPWMTDGHIVYPLEWDDQEETMVCCRDNFDRALKSPRCLKEIVANCLVTRSAIKFSSNQLPIEVHKLLLTEAVLQREAGCIEQLISNWPSPSFLVKECLPPEEITFEDKLALTDPLDNNTNTTLLDCILRALLKLSPDSPLCNVDFNHFSDEPNLCKEIFRLPLLWMDPSRREVEKIFPLVSSFIEVNRDKIRRYLNRLKRIYANVDCDIPHERNLNPMNIVLPGKLTIDDVAVGLAIQGLSPFTFCCDQIWISPIADMRIPLTQIRTLITPAKELYQLQVKTPAESMSCSTISDVLRGILQLPNLTCLSLLGGIDVIADPNMATLLNNSLRKLPHLLRLSLASCVVKGKLAIILNSLQELEYLNLSDCRLQHDDMTAIKYWAHSARLYELNLSNNNMRGLEPELLFIVKRLTRIVCLSVSYCCLSYEILDKLVYLCSTCCDSIKVLEMQTFTPLPFAQLRRLLYFIAEAESMQKCRLLPQTYAFPGDSESERHQLKVLTLSSCYYYLESKGRPDVLLC